MRRHVGTELAAWTAAAEVLELPAELARLLAELTSATADLERVSDQLAELEAAPTVSSRLAAGVDAETAVAEAAKADERHAVVSEAVTQVAGFAASRERAVRRWIAANRSALITDTLGPAVVEIVDEATPLVGKLERLAPAFNPTELASTATPAETSAWRKLGELDDRLEVILAAYVRTWHAATTAAGGHGGEKWPQYLRPSRAGGLHVWAAPELVSDLDVAYGVDRRLASITWWHARGGRYRLATARDLLALERQYTLEHPWGSRSQIAGVLMPGEARSENAERKLSVFAI
jgi:hypothetical protein